MNMYLHENGKKKVSAFVESKGVKMKTIIQIILIIAIIFFISLIKKTVYTQVKKIEMYGAYIGNQIILDKDTLTIVDYKSGGYHLSNGVVVDTLIVIQQLKLK